MSFPSTKIVHLGRTKIPFPLFYTGLTWIYEAPGKSVEEKIPIAISVNNTKYVFRDNEWKSASKHLTKLQQSQLYEITKNIELYNVDKGFESLSASTKALYRNDFVEAGGKVI